MVVDIKKTVDESFKEMVAEATVKRHHVITASRRRRRALMAAVSLLVITISAVILIITVSYVYQLNAHVDRQLEKYEVLLGGGGDADRSLELISVDRVSNMVQYDVTETRDDVITKHVTSISDFNRGIQVFRVNMSFDDDVTASTCYVTVLSARHASSVDDFSDLSRITSYDVSEMGSEVEVYDAIKTQIKDTGVLGPTARQLCADVNVHWIIPTRHYTRSSDQHDDDVIVTYVIRHQRDATRRVVRSAVDDRLQRGYEDDDIVRVPSRDQMASSGAFRVLDRLRRPRPHRRRPRPGRTAIAAGR